MVNKSSAVLMLEKWILNRHNDVTARHILRFKYLVLIDFDIDDISHMTYVQTGKGADVYGSGSRSKCALTPHTVSTMLFLKMLTRCSFTHSVWKITSCSVSEVKNSNWCKCTVYTRLPQVTFFQYCAIYVRTGLSVIPDFPSFDANLH